jgi:hypothetical protein
MTWTWHEANMANKMNSHRVLAGKGERKRPSGRHTHRWEGNIEMDLREDL